jgi:hypothetical protein
MMSCCGYSEREMKNIKANAEAIAKESLEIFISDNMGVFIGSEIATLRLYRKLREIGIGTCTAGYDSMAKEFYFKAHISFINTTLWGPRRY